VYEHLSREDGGNDSWGMYVVCVLTQIHLNGPRIDVWERGHRTDSWYIKHMLLWTQCLVNLIKSIAYARVRITFDKQNRAAAMGGFSGYGLMIYPSTSFGKETSFVSLVFIIISVSGE
jgi:hypothetical protein